MVNFTIEQVQSIMSIPENIRNISVIAHVDHGKTTLTGSLIAHADITAQSNVNYLDYKKEEIERGITIKSTGVSLYHELQENPDEKPQGFLINIIDSPGHVDFSSEVTAALRVTDGALVVVDCVESVCVQTETVLRQAMVEKIKPSLIINKVDRAILELQLDSEAIYQKFVKSIDLVNAIISNYEQPEMGELLIEPTKGNIAFGTGKDNWGFTLCDFAKIYAKKFNTDPNKLVEKLWGDYYYDQEAKKWTSEPYTDDGKPLKRAFNQFIMDPIIKVIKTILDGNSEQIAASLKKIEITLSEEQKELKGRALLKVVLPKWINFADSILGMVVKTLPSPKVAQKYRAAYLYEGPQDDPCCMAMKECDPKGPLMIYISKMVPAEGGHFYAFGRVFSGTVAPGQKVRIMGPNYVPGKKEDLAIKSIQRTVLMMGKNVKSITYAPCGNTVGLVGIDQYLVKTGTISDYEGAHNIRVMKYSVSPVVRVAVKPKNPTEIQKLVEGLAQLVRVDPLVQVSKEDTGEYVIGCSGELHAEICVSDLQNEYAKIEIKKSDPAVSYKETVTEKSSQIILCKSMNKHNRLFCQAEPIEEKLSLAIEKGEIGQSTDPKERSKKLVEDFGWEKEGTQKIWTFGPDNNGANILVDMSSGVQYLTEVRDSLESAFQVVTRNGVLCDENMRGVKINILDAKIHADPPHRGTGQMIECARRVYYGSFLSAKPRLQEPIFLAEISAPMEAMKGVYSCLNQRRATILDEIPLEGVPLNLLRAYLPVAESFGFTEALRQETGGKAFPQCVFSHWGEFNDDPLEQGTKAYNIVKSIRQRKGMKEEFPTLDMYSDKL